MTFSENAVEWPRVATHYRDSEQISLAENDISFFFRVTWP